MCYEREPRTVSAEMWAKTLLVNLNITSEMGSLRTPIKASKSSRLFSLTKVFTVSPVKKKANENLIVN